MKIVLATLSNKINSSLCCHSTHVVSDGVAFSWKEAVTTIHPCVSNVVISSAAAEAAVRSASVCSPGRSTSAITVRTHYS